MFGLPDQWTPWIMAVLGAGGFFITWNRIVVAVTNTVNAISLSMTEKINDETNKITKSFTDEIAEVNANLNELSSRFDEDQRTQDNRFGEVALSIRQYIANVEKEMHAIEMWGRDHYVQQHPFDKSTERIEQAIATMTAELRADLRQLAARVDKKTEEGS